MNLLMFTKMLKDLGNLTLEQAGDLIANMGFDGADLTVRHGGYVLPEEATEKLPQAVELLKSKGLAVPMITTNITDANEDHARAVFETASRCGIKFIKLGYWPYKGFGNIKSQISEARSYLKGIERLSVEHGVTAAIHTHSGAFLSADPGIVLMLLEGFDPENICAYFDPGHIAAQGGPAAWEMGLDILSHQIRLIAVKNFIYLKMAGEARWEHKMLPLREEIVQWPSFFKHLRELGFDGNVSLHSEYDGFTLEQLIFQTREDLDYIKKILRGLDL
jgi:sugar phosphate isomerase/epimerase